MMIALVLRRALKAWRPEFEDRVKANEAVVTAAGEAPIPENTPSGQAEAIEHLRTTYPNPLSHLRTARRYSIVTPVLLFALLVMGRFVLGVI